MPLSKKQQLDLDEILRHANRAMDYLLRQDIAICRARNGLPSTTLDFTRPSDDRVLYEVEKTYGSDLCGLHDVIRLTQWFKQRFGDGN